MPHRLRDRRIENEWGLLRDAQRSQPSIVELFDRESISDGESFRLALHETSGIVEIDGHRSVISSHHVEIRFPRFFPSVLLEVRLARPVFHPNVDPQNGFVCLWNRFAVEYTAVAALRQLQSTPSPPIFSVNGRMATELLKLLCEAAGAGLGNRDCGCARRGPRQGNHSSGHCLKGLKTATAKLAKSRSLRVATVSP